MKVEKAIEKVKLLLAVANDKGATEHEALAAALKAQELMAKYDIDLVDVEDESASDEIVSSEIHVGNGNKWKYQIALIVAANFCCRIYSYGASTIVFHGYRKHAEVAKEVFTFLYNTGNKLADRYYAQRYNNGEPTKGVKNTFLMGYCDGIKSVLEKQCTALALVISKEVDESFEKITSGGTTRKMNLKMNHDHNAYEDGKYEGKNIANARSLEG